jgi:hypothetical protein
MSSSLYSPSDRGAFAACLSFMFSAITSAMQPARLPIALLAVLLVSGLAPLVDGADGQSFGPRGLAAGPLSDSEVELNYQRARSAANRLAGEQVDALETGIRAEGSDAGARIPRSALAAAVREATAGRIAERIANGAPADDPELRRLRQRLPRLLWLLTSLHRPRQAHHRVRTHPRAGRPHMRSKCRHRRVAFPQ